jgi:hypothetical protein
MIRSLLAGMFFLSSIASGGVEFTCRAESPQHGAIAVTLRDGFSAKGILRNCGLIDEIAQHFGIPAKRYDTFVATVLASKCVVEQDSAGKAVGYACDFVPTVGEEPLDPTIGNQLEMKFSSVRIRLLTLQANQAYESQVTIVADGKTYNKVLPVPRLLCENGMTIAENEAICRR